MVDRAQNEIDSVAVVLHQSGFPQIEHGRFFETLLYPTLLIIRTFSPRESTDCQQLICLRDCGAVKHDFLLTNVRFHRFLTGRKSVGSRDKNSAFILPKANEIGVRQQSVRAG